MVRLTQLRGFKRIVYKILKKLGFIKEQRITEEQAKEMCKRAQGICDHDCNSCIWGNLDV